MIHSLCATTLAGIKTPFHKVTWFTTYSAFNHGLALRMLYIGGSTLAFFLIGSALSHNDIDVLLVFLFSTTNIEA